MHCDRNYFGKSDAFRAKPTHRIDWRKATRGSQRRDWTIDPGKQERLPTQSLKSEFIGGW